MYVFCWEFVHAPKKHGLLSQRAARPDGAPWEQQDKQYQQQLNKVDEQINKADEQIERLDKLLDAWEKKGPSVKVPSDR